jgi:Xaa-Pro aminopeptidase
MSATNTFTAVQAAMREARIDGWLVHDFRGSNQVLSRLLPGKRHLTRRVELFIPARGEPALLVHGLDAPQFEGLPIRRELYTSWRDLHSWLGKAVATGGRIAMEYSPGAALPVVSAVDAGTVELVRSLGAEVVSSANLIQVCIAVWSPEAVAGHARASAEVAAIKDGAFGLIRSALAAGRSITEIEVQQHIMGQFEKAGLQTVDPPIVGANAHSGDPHFDLSAASSVPIRKGDWVLIDLWARRPGDENIFSDITWVGFAGSNPSPRHREVFQAVKAARDASVRAAQDAWKAKRPIQGWELDEAARAQIISAGFEKFIRHRTGHSLSPGPMVHGLGMNLDNLETHDTREMLPGIGFTIEPGIYLPEFGVRLEINMYVDPQRGPIITSCNQDEIVLLG